MTHIHLSRPARHVALITIDNLPKMNAMTRLARHSVSPAERIANVLHPWSSFLIVPIFALANAGVSIKASAFDGAGATAVTAGIMLGLVAGKTLGITGAAWLGVRLGVARLPEGADWRMMFGIAAVAGIGFTVSLFVAELAFTDGALRDAAKIGVLAASAVAAVIGGIALSRACRDKAMPGQP